MKRTLILLVAAALLPAAAACGKSEAPAPATGAANANAAGQAATPAADQAKAADGKAPEAKPADGAADGTAAPADNKPADDAAKQPAANDGADPAATPTGDSGELALGQNSPSFLDGIEGKPGDQLIATIDTSMGPLKCELYEKRTPQTVLNFVGLARGMKAFVDPATKAPTKKPFYDGIAFHRVIPQFMVQVGDPTGTGAYNPGYRFNDEIVPELKHDTGGILSMANAGPGTNGSQFFITEVPTPHLNGRHTVFGKCDNVELISKIARVATGPRDKPLEPVIIKTVTFKRGY